MPYTSIWCSCENRRFGLDHYRSGECKNPPMHLPWLIGMVKSLTEDVLHATGNITATRVLTCPRAVMIGDYKDCDVWPLSHNTGYEGTVRHWACERYPAPGAHVEVVFPAEGQPPPIILGLPMRGKMDYLPTARKIVDLKSHNTITQGYKDPASKYWEADTDSAVQLNIYRFAREALKIEGVFIEEMEIIHQASVSGGPRSSPASIREQVPFMTEEQILQHKPARGTTTVAEIIEEYKAFQRRIAEGMLLDTALKMMKLVGRTMYPDKKTGVGQKCAYWCVKGVKAWCDHYEGIESGEAQSLRGGQ